MSRGFRLLLSALRDRPWVTAAALVTAILAVVLQVTVPLLTGSAIDVATGATTDTAATRILPGWEPIAAIVVLLIAVAVGQYAFQFLRRWAAGRLSIDTQHDIRVRILDVLQRLDGPGQDRIVTGQVVSRSISDLGGLQSVIALAPLFGSRIIQLILTLIVMLFVSPLLTGIALVFVPVIVLVAAGSRRSLYAATWVNQQVTADLATHVEQTVSGVRVVKAFAQEDREVDRLDQLGQRLYSVKMRAAKLTARFQPVLQQLPRIALVATILVGGMMVMSGSITVGVFFAFSTYLTSMTQLVSMLSNSYITLQLGMSSVERIDDILSLRPEHTDPENPEELPEGALGLRFSGVDFSEGGHQILDSLELEAAPGETIAVIGPPGAGKSMAVQLAGGFYRPDTGHLELTARDGTAAPYDALTDRSIRSAVTCVFDEAFLYSSTIRTNIAMGLDATDADVEHAARLAQAHDFITDLDDGYDTAVGERGLTLSGGQRQRIALARALLARPRVLLLDDATSAIDATTEKAILDGLREELEDVTVIAVAHRESTLSLAQRVLIVEEGRVVADGTTTELADNPSYRALMSSEPAARPAAAEQPAHADLWPAVDESNSAAHVSADTSAVGGHGGAIAATPGLLDDVEKLPAATEEVELDTTRLRAHRSEFRVRDLFKAVRWLIVAAVALMVVGVIADLSFPWLMGVAVDQGVNDPSGNTLWAIAAVGLVVVAVAWAAGWASTIITSRSGERLLYGLRLRSFSHLQRLSMDYYETTLSGKIMTRMTTDIDTLSRFLQTGLVQAVVNVATLVGIIAMLVWTDLGLSLIALAAIPLIALATAIFRPISRHLYTAAREQISSVNGEFQESVSGLRTAQMHGITDDSLRSFRAGSETYRRLRMRAQVAVATYFPGMQAISQITTAIVLGVGAGRVADGELSAGVLVAYVMYLGQLYGPIQALGMVFDSWQQASVSFNRVTDLLASEPTVADTGERGDAAAASRGTLALKDIDFAYGDDATPVARNLSVEIAPGTTVALVGTTGAGKSTVVKLLARFYDPTAGAVTASGTDIRQFPLHGWRRAIVQVPQEAHLFMGTVADNIRYGAPGASDAEIQQAVERIGALDVVAAIPGGFRAPVGERGRGLSAGQRQIVALARAELLGPDVMALDEATATLDPATEAAFLDASQRATHGRTSIIVAHRLATAARADRILVLASGAVVEDGNHKELLANGGLYAKMWTVHQ